AVGILDSGPQARWGSINGMDVQLRLIRHPAQDSNFRLFPSAAYMMRHVYQLGRTVLGDVDVRIVNVARSPESATPLRAQSSTYLHLFGLDDVNNQSGASGPDGKFDNDVNRLDVANGFLFMPGTRPFSPSIRRLQERLASAGVLPDSVAALASSFA